MTEQISTRELREIDALVGTPQKDMALGGAFEGAAVFERQIARWMPTLGSADSDMLPAKGMLDARARDLGRNDAYVHSGVQQHKDGVVGGFYMLNAKPTHSVLATVDSSFDETWAEAFQNEVEPLFTLWAESPKCWVDAQRQKDFTAMIRLAVGVTVLGGEVLATSEWVTQQAREFRTAIQMVDADRLSTPLDRRYDQRIRGGIKTDAYGAPVSAFIKVAHSADARYAVNSADSYKWREVQWEKPWGREMVIYIREQERVDQTRAVSDLTAGLKEVAMLKKFRDVTLQKAVLAASYAATIESELPPEAVYQQLGASGAPGDPAAAVTQYAAAYLAGLQAYIGSSKNMQIDGLKIPHLYPGTKFNMVRAGDPAGVGQGFETSMLRYVAAALNLSYEELSKDYSKTNYSSARAAMLQTWKFMQSRKKNVADMFANKIYRLWLEEAINLGRLKTFPKEKADLLYTNGYQNLMFDALARAEWIGAARGQIDELKETQAAVLRIKYGLSTHEDELARLGKDWRQTYAQLEREAKDRELRGIVLLEDNSVNAASGAPREQQQDGTEEDDPDA